MSGTTSILDFIPSVWPVVQRELRARARKPRYFAMRVLAGVAAMLIVYTALQRSVSPSAASMYAFGSLSLLLLAVIVVTAPAMISDCLSLEKREGTLGLLFLTPLTPAGIVIGKCAAQALLVWSLWLSVLPAMAVPLLLGGLTWKNMAVAAVAQFSTVLISLASGLLASCLTKRRNLALFYATVLTSICVSSILILIYALEFMFVAVKRGMAWPTAFDNVWRELDWRGLAAISDGLAELVFLQSNQLGGPRMPFASIMPLTSPILIALPCAAVLILAVAIWFAARHIRKTWSDKPASARQQWWNQRFCTVLFQGWFRRRMQHSLDSNPIAWLQQYSWKARITKWGLCLLFIIIELWAIPTDTRSLYRMQIVQTPLLFILAAVGTVAGVGSFRSEKESGALELILITPLSVNAIIFGRVIGWWKQFLPAALMFLLFVGAVRWAIFPIYGNPFDPIDLTWFLCFFVTAYLSLPFFAVYAALRARYFVVAVALALIGLAVEFALGRTLAFFLGDYNSPDTGLLFVCTLVSSAVFVRLTFFLLRHSLSRRIYSF